MVALVVDLPATRQSERLPESLAYQGARAHAGAGFTLELAGGVALGDTEVVLTRGGGQRFTEASRHPT